MSARETAETEVLVVGGGPAGYVAAIRAAQLDRAVTLVERDALGGTCLNYGCIPSKALVSATDLAHEAGSAEDMGIHADPTVDLAGMVEWKDGVVDRLTGGVEKLCKANGIELVTGTARFDEPGVARVDGPGGDRTIAFDDAIVATGSRPTELEPLPFEAEPIFDARAALSPTSIPDAIVIVGAGYIGMELAGVYAKLGTDVTVVEALERPLVAYDSALVEPVRRRAESLGVTFAFDRSVTGWEERGERVAVQTDPTDPDVEPLTVEADAILVAVGREPVTDGLGLEAVDLGTDETGAIPTDERGRTERPGIYAVGDVAGEPMLAHAGMAEGRVAAETIAGGTPTPPRAVPTVVFTDPEIATVGLTESEASAADHEPVVGTFPFRASGRALTAGETDGLVRVVADASGRLLGGAVVGPEASELVAELGLAVEVGATLEDVAGTVHAHPTLSEAVLEATENGLGRAIHTLNR